MKKFLLLVVPILSLIACSNEELIPNVENNQLQEIQQKYEATKSNARINFGGLAAVISGHNTSRSESSPMTGNDYVQFLASLPKEKVDSLYEIYCTPSMEATYENNIDIVEQALIDNSSIEEVQALYNFTDSYIQSGGHNMTLLINESQQVSPLISDCMVISAATIDEFILDNSDYRLATSHCIRDLYVKLVEMYTGNVIAEGVCSWLAAVPGLDALTQLVMAGCDLYSAIKLAHEYNICCATSVS
ncbi:hypothetical protein [uncultured Muribaculum sp.]|uniref:hypothetical protein n=1 Tax=uncultured Muribaculum sp. TaxID=1918613 RepID=UPI00260BBE65|nr:hypothetical protein [uncultured Muribaculum sp.]